MNMPGFHAEASLGPALGVYRGVAVHSRSGNTVAVKPQQLLAPRIGIGGLGVGGVVGIFDCHGSTQQCIENNCIGLPVKQQGICRSACQQPSKCSGCVCTCSPNCARTCQRTCTRSFTNAAGGFIVLTCRGDCTGVAQQ